MTDFKDAREFAEAMMLYRMKHPPKKPKKKKTAKPNAKFDFEKVKKMHDAGVSATDIAKEYNVPRHAISNFMSRNGITNMKRETKYNLEEIKQLRENGTSFEEIAEKYGSTPKAIKSFCARHNILKHKQEKKCHQTPEGRKTKYDLDEIIQMIKCGKTAKEIAEQLGVNTKAIQSLLRRNGIKIREIHNEISE